MIFENEICSDLGYELYLCNSKVAVEISGYLPDHTFCTIMKLHRCIMLKRGECAQISVFQEA